MITYIRTAILVLIAMIDSMPQEFTEADGSKSRIPDDNYTTLIADGVIAMVAGAGFQDVGLSEAQLRGAVKGFCPVVAAWKKAPRVVA